MSDDMRVYNPVPAHGDQRYGIKVPCVFVSPVLSEHPV